ncbi:MAG: PhoH family protein [Planctomycetota bacterium]|nr:PhoH family protein [Planctomycetota bacterium]
MPRERIPQAGEAEQRILFGPMDRHLRAVRERFGVRISARHEVLTLEGPDDAAVQEVARRVKRALGRASQPGEPTAEEIEDILIGDGIETNRRTRAPRGPRGQRRGAPRPPGAISGPVPKRPKPRTKGQEAYVEAIRKNDVVFAIGPAGTGKTFLAVVEAVDALRAGSVKRIVLTRPAVEAGEKLGFLPGDFHAKINPYLRPLYDALGELIPWGEVQRYMDADVIEIVPLAYMRGRTLKGAFIILDEGQNTTPAQMKMFLTRLGEGSKVVINGDVTQIDLPDSTRSGLVDSIAILDGVKGLSVIRFGPQDIQRHKLVQRIVDAYDRDDERRAAEDGEDPR